MYNSADGASNERQATFLHLIRAEYILLFVASVLSLDLWPSQTYFAIYAGVFLCSMGVLIFRSVTKPEQVWYQARALAESVKTLTWRFAMRAQPFDDAKVADARADFRKLMADILDSNRHIGNALSGTDSASPQTTDEMMAVRDSSLKDRKDLYLQKRIGDQRKWYERKARANKRSAKTWMGLGVVAYGLGFAFIVVRIADPTMPGWPTEPLIVVASALIGWTQIKKFNELASAYTLTAHEIGLTADLIDDAKTDDAFSAAVNEAELAFSREHTQWVARQNN
ncbi:DUF4231 domain-containing protein [Mesorhizobium sp. M0320]|uniref:DUF4231 domain-containing protein n=1 Tax=unclassified Mesorhizobium TaxID=325217 RepID=UPI00333C0AC5